MVNPAKKNDLIIGPTVGSVQNVYTDLRAMSATERETALLNLTEATKQTYILHELAHAIAIELNAAVALSTAKDVFTLYKRNKSTSKLALSEAIKFIMRKDFTLAMSNNVMVHLAASGIVI